jgi:glycosyltransferase involved in cell wall biosynthesis
MNTSPALSVLVPTYNHERFIGACLDSILQQGYPNLEIVVADDASTDTTRDILRDYQQRHPDVIRLLLQEKNVGATPNARACFAACTGKYVAMFSGDDVMLPGKLIRQVEYMETHPECVASYHDQEVFDSESGALLGYYNHGPGSLVPREGGAELLVRHGVFCGGSSLMVLRSAAPPHVYDERVLIASDWLFEIELVNNGKIGFINETLTRWRRHALGLSKLPRGLDEIITLAIVDQQYPHLRRHTRFFRLRYFGRYAAKALLFGSPRVAARYVLELCRAIVGLPGLLVDGSKEATARLHKRKALFR